MVYLESPSMDPYFNLALEEYIFEHMDRSKAYFLLWQNENTIVVGKFQNTAEEINQQYVAEHGIRVVRRLSGGGAVYHDRGNLNFTLIVDQDAAPNFHFAVFALPVVRTLEALGVHAEFNGRNDITIDGQKISGSAQYVRKGRLLHHGCIMLDANLDVMERALQVREAKYASKSVKSVRSRVTTINAHTTSPVSMARLKNMLKETILQSGAFEPLSLTAEQLEGVTRLRKEKYATWEWNYGASPKYDVKKERKFPAGLLTALLSVSKGCIQSVRFYGDFFGSGDLAGLEQALSGLPLDDALEERLRLLDVGTYIHGISPRDLFELMMY